MKKKDYWKVYLGYSRYGCEISSLKKIKNAGMDVHMAVVKY